MRSGSPAMDLTVSNAQTTHRVSPIETHEVAASGGSDPIAIERPHVATKSKRTTLRGLALTAVRRAKSAAIGGSIAALLVGTTFVATPPSAYAQRVTTVQAVQQVDSAQKDQIAAVNEMRQLQ